MVEIKYKREAKKKKIKGMKDPVTVYKKAGSSKLYVKCKGRMRSYVSYKKSCLKKLSAKKAKPVKRKTRVRGGNGCNMDQGAQQGGEFSGDLLSGGGNKLKSQKYLKSQNKLSQRQKGGIIDSILKNVVSMEQQGGAGAKRRRRRGRRGRTKGGSEDGMDMSTHQQMEEYENNVEDDPSSVLGGGRRRRRRSASPKRRRAASPKRRRSASPKRRRAASPKRRRSTRR